MPALRPRLDVAYVVAGERYDLTTTVRDAIELKRQLKGAATGDVEDIARLAWIAARRLGLTALDFDAFVDQLEDIEANEPPPLAAAAPSPDSSPPPPELPAYHLESSPA